ncbi:Cell surface protein [bioreactor metagenome]|uniref:Cell surface protein n=1 Tax=bioreactor metagenome TaxID=1076179 RepID=A0A644WDU9_9ZZZZ
MKNLKRALCLILVCAMTFGLMIMTTSAADFTDKDEIVNTDAVDTMVALNIINGKDDGSYFDPSGIVTRAEMCKMICVALNGGKDPQLGTTASSYTDTAGTWAAGYIEYCTNLGIVAGRGNGIFDPTGTVTGTEAAKMLLVAIGYDSTAEGFTGANWAIAVNVRANGKDLYEDLEDMDPSAGLTRDNAAQMVYNAINAVMVEYTYSLTTVGGALQSVAKVGDVDNEVTILSKKFDMLTKYGRMVGISYDEDTEKYTYTFDNISDYETADYVNGKLTTKVDYSKYYGMDCKLLYKDNSSKTVYGFTPDDSQVLAEGILNNIGTVKTDSFKFNGTVYDVDDADGTSDTLIYSFCNAGLGTTGLDAGTTSVAAIDAADKPFDCKLIDLDGDGDVDYVIAVPFTVAKVTYVGSTTFTVGTSYKFSDTETFDGMAKGDYVVFTAKANTAKNINTFAAVDSVVKGKATATNSEGSKLTVDGTSYNVYDGAFTAAVGTSYEGMQVVNGFVFKATVTASVSSDDFAVVVAVETAASGVNTYPQAKLLLKDGTKIVVDYDKAASTNSAEVVGGNLAIGDFVSFDKDSDDVYTLTAYQNFTANTTEVKAATDFDGAVTAADFTYDKDGDSTIGSNYIDADAIIFYKNASGSWKVKTGAELAKTNSDITVDVAFFNENSSTGFNSVALAFIKSATAISDSSTFYGYLTGDATLAKNSDDDTVSQVTFWNGTQSVTALCDANYSAGIKYGTDPDSYYNKPVKNSIIVYTLSGDEVCISDIYPVKSTDGTGADLGTVAVKGYSGSILSFYSGTTPNAGAYADTAVTGNWKITDDTVILYVDTENAVGQDDGEVSLADETPASTDADPAYYCNAFYIKDTGTDLALLVIDISNDISDVL